MNYEQLKYSWSNGELSDEEFFTTASDMGFDLEVERDLSIYLNNLETTLVPEFLSWRTTNDTNNSYTTLSLNTYTTAVMAIRKQKPSVWLSTSTSKHFTKSGPYPVIRSTNMTTYDIDKAIAAYQRKYKCSFSDAANKVIVDIITDISVKKMENIASRMREIEKETQGWDQWPHRSSLSRVPAAMRSLRSQLRFGPAFGGLRPLTDSSTGVALDESLIG
jgi:hypothetical protein